MIAAGLAAVGVTEERVKKLVGDCGCARRKNKLDALGEGVTKAIQSTANRTLDAILPHPITEDDVAALAQSIAASPLTNQGLKDRAAGKRLDTSSTMAGSSSAAPSTTPARPPNEIK